MQPPKLNHIKESCLYVNNLDDCKHFYGEILGLPIIHYKEERHIFFRIGGDVLLFFIPEATKSDDSMPRHFAQGEQHIAFECPIDAYEKWKLHLKKHNIPIEQEIDWPNGGKSFYFRGPERMCLEIVQPGIWGD